MPRKSGTERLHIAGKPLETQVLDFWQWAASALLDNTVRGLFAEWLVGTALGCAVGVREEWAPHDLEAHGMRIEVKSSAYIQSWELDRQSAPSFRIAPSRTWTATSGWSEHKARNADLFVFALYAHRDRGTADPLDVSQWQFWCVPTPELDERFGAQKNLSLGVLQRLAEPVPYDQLAATVAEAAKG